MVGEPKALDLLEELLLRLSPSLSPHLEARSPKLDDSLRYALQMLARRISPSVATDEVTIVESIKRFLVTEAKTSDALVFADLYSKFASISGPGAVDNRWVVLFLLKAIAQDRRISKRGREDEERAEGQQRVVRRKKGAQEDNSRDWASLPWDILALIFRPLPLLEAIHSAAVCKPWRAVAAEVPRDPQLPWFWKERSREFYSLSEDKMYNLHLPDELLNLPEEVCREFCYGARFFDLNYFEPVFPPACFCGSYEEWMIVCHRIEGDLGHFLFNPFSDMRIELPKIFCVASWDTPKIVLSSPPDNPDCLAARLYCDPTSDFAYSLCITKLVGQDSGWTALQQEDVMYDDIIFYKHLLYVATSIGELKLVEISSSPDIPLRVSTVLPRPRMEGAQEYFRGLHYLMECGGELIMLRASFGSQANAIFQANLRFNRWEMVESLGGRVIIFASCCCTTMRAAKLLGLEEDCIYHIVNNHDVCIFRVAEKITEVKKTSDVWRCPFENLLCWVTLNPWKSQD